MHPRATARPTLVAPVSDIRRLLWPICSLDISLSYRDLWPRRIGEPDRGALNKINRRKQSMARGGARPGAGRPAGKSPNTSPPSTRARARARETAGNQRPWPADKGRAITVISAMPSCRAASILAWPAISPPSSPTSAFVAIRKSWDADLTLRNKIVAGPVWWICQARNSHQRSGGSTLAKSAAL
jgi:hypothetical protein